MNETTQQPLTIVLIDLEYAGWNPRGFDLGNHFCEWASNFQSAQPHQLDFERCYPNHQQQKTFLTAYLTPKASSSSSAAAPIPAPSEDEVESLIDEANEYALASHLYWGTWGLLQSCLSNLDFDFLAYASQRLRAYYKGMEGERGGPVPMPPLPAS